MQNVDKATFMGQKEGAHEVCPARVTPRLTWNSTEIFPVPLKTLADLVKPSTLPATPRGGQLSPQPLPPPVGS